MANRKKSKSAGTYSLASINPEAVQALEKARALLKPVETIYRWVDAETQNVVFGTRSQWEDYLASR
jgi:hypothetical protein